MKTKKITLIYLYEEKLKLGTMFKTEVIGNKPSEHMAKNAIKELLKYAGKIHEIR